MMYFQMMYFFCRFYVFFNRRFFDMIEIDFNNKRIQRRFFFVDDNDDDVDDEKVDLKVFVENSTIILSIVFRDLSRLIDLSKKRRFVD